METPTVTDGFPLRSVMPRLLLLTPPFTQLNTPYPATAYLTGYLRSKIETVFQTDLGSKLFWRSFHARGWPVFLRRLNRARRGIRRPTRGLNMRSR